MEKRPVNPDQGQDIVHGIVRPIESFPKEVLMGFCQAWPFVLIIRVGLPFARRFGQFEDGRCCLHRTESLHVIHSMRDALTMIGSEHYRMIKVNVVGHKTVCVLAQMIEGAQNRPARLAGNSGNIVADSMDLDQVFRNPPALWVWWLNDQIDLAKYPVPIIVRKASSQLDYIWLTGRFWWGFEIETARCLCVEEDYHKW